MKNKMIALIEIAIVLCSMFLVATLPAIAAEQNVQQEMQKVSANTITTASEDDYVLGIYGNANEDDTIDMGDVVYTKLAIFGKKPKTELCDAKYDGRINVLDVIQTKLIILGKEKELTIIDSGERTVTVKKPVERIIVVHPCPAEAIQVLNARDKVVGVSTSFKRRSVEFPELSELPGIGTSDFEAILNVNPDVVLGISWAGSATDRYKPLPDSIVVIGLDFHRMFSMREELKKLGYILDKEDEAKEFIDFYEIYLNKIKERVEGLSEGEKPRVYFGYGCKPGSLYVADTTFDEIDIAGGRNVAADLTEDNWGAWWGTTGWWPTVDPEWVIKQNPDFIFSRFSASGGYISDDPSGMKDLCDCIKNLPELAHVNAVKNDRVYAVHYDLVTGAGEFLDVIYFARLFHPDLFGDLDPKAIHQEYIDQFKRIDFNVYEHGVFVYPPLKD